MLLIILDGQGQPQTVIAHGQETVVNHDGTLAGAASQQALPANADRSGYVIVNASGNDMWVSDVGAASAGGDSFKVSAGGTWPPAGYPVATGAVNIKGTMGDKYLARDW